MYTWIYKNIIRYINVYLYTFIYFTYIFIYKLSITESQMLSPFGIGLGKEHPPNILFRIKRLGLDRDSTICYVCGDLEQGINSYHSWYLHSFNEDNIVGPLYLWPEGQLYSLSFTILYKGLEQL